MQQLSHHLTREIRCVYKDLKLHVDSGPQRSQLVALFANLSISLNTNRQNLGQPKANQTHVIEIDRDPNESVVGFIFRGLKDAAIGVSKANLASGHKANVHF